SPTAMGRRKPSSQPIVGWVKRRSSKRSMAMLETLLTSPEGRGGDSAIAPLSLSLAFSWRQFMALPNPLHTPSHDKLRALGIVALNGMFDEMDAVGVLRYATSEVLPGDLAIVSSFGADSAVLLHLVAQVDPSMPVYFLETG